MGSTGWKAAELAHGVYKADVCCKMLYRNWGMITAEVKKFVMWNRGGELGQMLKTSGSSFAPAFVNFLLEM